MLKKADVNFTVLIDEPDSGYALNTLIGAAEETRRTMIETGKKLSGFNTMVVFDPADAKEFIQQYKEWDIQLHAQIITFSSFIASLINT